MQIRFFKINSLTDIGTGAEKHLATIESEVVPPIGTYVTIGDGFGREVACVDYFYDYECGLNNDSCEVHIEVMLYKNKMFED